MAGGDGGFSGFSMKPMGFDKTEVNDYIAKLNQRMKDIEADKKANDEKTQAALKKAQDADKALKLAKVEAEKQAQQLEMQLRTEKENAQALLAQIDDYKKKLKQKASMDASSAKAAEKKAAEIIDKANNSAIDIVERANATAKDTVEKAKKTAHQIVSGAQGVSGGISTAGIDEFMGVFGDFMNKISLEMKEVNKKAEELLGAKAEKSAAVDIPDFSKVKAPQAKAPEPAPVPKVSESAKPSSDKKKSNIDNDIFSAFDDEPETSLEDELDEIVTEVKPLDGPNKGSGAVVLDEFDLTASGKIEDFDEPVTEVKPISNKKGKADLSEDFEKQMLAQAVSSRNIRRNTGVSDDMFAEVKRQEEEYAVKPATNRVGDFDMDASAEEDPMSEILKQADMSMNKKSVSEKPKSSTQQPVKSKSEPKDDDSNPWAALQNELLAMEKSGSLGGEEEISDDDSSMATDPTTPSADDSAIWDFGDDMGSSSDDDGDMSMSADLFGSF